MDWMLTVCRRFSAPTPTRMGLVNEAFMSMLGTLGDEWSSFISITGADLTEGAGFDGPPCSCGAELAQRFRKRKRTGGMKHSNTRTARADSDADEAEAAAFADVSDALVGLAVGVVVGVTVGVAVGMVVGIVVGMGVGGVVGVVGRGVGTAVGVVGVNVGLVDGRREVGDNVGFDDVGHALGYVDGWHVGTKVGWAMGV